MATSNFYNRNASCVYAFDPQSDKETFTDENGEYYDFKEDYEEDYEDLQYNLNYEFEKLAKENKEIGYWKGEGKDNDSLRSYPASVFGKLFIDRQFKDFSVRVIVIPVIRSGYYSGSNLDWVYDFEVEGDNTDDVEDFTNILEYVLDSRAMAEYKASFASKWATQTLKELTGKVEAIFEQYSTPLRVMATFSNGETIYEKV